MCLFFLEVNFCMLHIWMDFACLWCVNTFMQCEFCITVFTCVLGGGGRGCWLLCQRLLSSNKVWFKVDQSTPGIVPRPSFPLQPVEMRSLHNIYPGNNDVWFDSLLGVSLQRAIFIHCCHWEKTDRSYVHRRKKKVSDHCLWMMLGWCIFVLGLRNVELLCCTVGSVTHSRSLSLLHSSKMLLTRL